MSNTSIEVKIGEFSFSGTGSEQWLSKELDKILSKAAELVKLNQNLGNKNSAVNQNQQDKKDNSSSNASEVANKPLAKFLSEKNASKVQTQKFLATAVWLHEKGANRITTKEISAALKNANQTKLNNPSDCLNQNITKGLCEKEGGQFFVTEDGRSSFGA